MTGSGFFQQRRRSPGGLALVVAMHAAALVALALMKPPIFEPPIFPRTAVKFVPLPPEPAPHPPPRADPRPSPPAHPLAPPPPPFTPPSAGPIVPGPPLPPLPPLPEPGAGAGAGPRPLPPAPPARIEAEFDPRHAGDRQPPYPPAELRAEREGSVRVALTIGADGRVRAVRRLAATHDAFWRATERHALARWRFRPATIDGRPVESRKVMTVYFRIEG